MDYLWPAAGPLAYLEVSKKILHLHFHNIHTDTHTLTLLAEKVIE